VRLMSPENSASVRCARQHSARSLSAVR